MDPIISPLLLFGSTIGTLMSLYTQLSTFPPLEEDVGLPSYEFFLLDHEHGIYVFREKYPSLEVYADYYGFIFAVWSEQEQGFNWFHEDTAGLDSYAMSDFESGTYPDYFVENTSTSALELLDPKTGEVIQAIPHGDDLYSFSNFSSEGYADERLLNGFDFSDYNFDGIPDIGFMIASGTGGDTYHVWLYDLDLKSFVYHPELTHIGLYPDPDLKRIVIWSSSQMGASSSRSEYAWIDGVLQEVSHARQGFTEALFPTYQNGISIELDQVTLALLDSWEMYRIVQIWEQGEWLTLCRLYFNVDGSYFLEEGASLEDCIKSSNLTEIPWKAQ